MSHRDTRATNQIDPQRRTYYLGHIITLLLRGEIFANLLQIKSMTWRGSAHKNNKTGRKNNSIYENINVTAKRLHLKLYQFPSGRKKTLCPESDVLCLSPLNYA